MNKKTAMTSLPKHKAWADLAVFEDTNAAEVLASFLEHQGLETRTNDDKLFRYFLFLRPPRATFRVQVRQDEFDSAEAFLATGTPAALQHAIRCPSCASRRVSYPQMTRKFILPTLLLHLGIIFRLIEHECYCDRCHFTWNLPDGQPRPLPVDRAPFPLGPIRPWRR